MKFKILLSLESKNATFLLANIDIKSLVCGEKDETKLAIWRFKLHVLSWGDYSERNMYLIPLPDMSSVWKSLEIDYVKIDLNVHKNVL